MQKKIAYLLVKNEKYTAFMQAADVFEPFKFIGSVMKLNEIPDNATPENMMKMFLTQKIKLPIVSVIIPGMGCSTLQPFTVMSNGKNWATIEKIAAALENNGERQIKAHGFEVVTQ